MYMSGITFYKTWSEAEKAHAKAPSTCLEQHKDGSAVIVTLQDYPVYPGQVEYKGKSNG